MNKTIILSDRNLLLTKDGDYARPSELVDLEIELRGYDCLFQKTGIIDDFKKVVVNCKVKESFGTTIDLVMSTGIPLQLGSNTKVLDYGNSIVPAESLERNIYLTCFPWVYRGKDDNGVINISDYSLLGEGTVNLFDRDFLKLTGWFISHTFIETDGRWSIPRIQDIPDEEYREFFKRLNIPVVRLNEEYVKLAPCYTLDILLALFGKRLEKGIPDEYLLSISSSSLRYVLDCGESVRKADSGRFTTRCNRGFCYDLALAYTLAEIPIYVMIGENSYGGTKERFRWKRTNRSNYSGKIIHGTADTTSKRVYEITINDKEDREVDTLLWTNGVGVTA